ncbi:MAG TPA: PQQ-dependent sugar dehydrogenase, partial [Nitrospirota bacterium]|nr:PQQ-dependent sugar dehydrogenase [Nitrospirota bacterium]
LVSCCGEQGLLGLAFPPGFAAKKYFYINYTDTAGNTVIARYHVSPSDPDAALRDSAEVILTVDQPFANHNGGRLAFGPDGFLYIGLGDGGSERDPLGNAQNSRALLGKMLRVDVEGAVVPYGIPAGNPFAGNVDFRQEIWATGLRNPWRYSFDALTGDLYIADVGENLREEVNFQPASGRGGENYGWNIMEGLSCFGTGTCSQTGLTLPIADYDHGLGCSVIGGHVYRGAQFPSLRGFYLYGDLCSGRIWGLRKAGDLWENVLLLDSDIAITTFGLDEAGELYVTDYAGGGIYRVIVP